MSLNLNKDPNNLNKTHQNNTNNKIITAKFKEMSHPLNISVMISMVLLKKSLMMKIRLH